MTQKINPLLIKTDSAAQGSLLSIGANGPTWTAPTPATDSAQVVTIITDTVDSSYVQARQLAQDFSYSSLTGAPNVLDSTNVSSIISADVDAAFINALTIDADTLGNHDSSYYLDYTNFTNKPNILDSANVIGIVDSAYVQSLQNSNFATEAFVSTAVDSAITALVNAAPTTLDTLNELAAALGDDANFSVTITNAIAAKLDSVDAIALIDSNYVQLRQTPQDFAYSSLTGTPNILDSANVSSIITNTVDKTYVDGLAVDATTLGGETDAYYLDYTNFTNVPNVLDSADVALIAASIGGVDSASTITLITSTVDSAYVALRAPAAGSSVTVSGTAPVSPSEGDLWFDDSDTGILYVYENSNWTATGIPPAAGVDSADIIQLIDSDYVQARVVVSGVDSASTIALITSTVDSAYVQSRQTAQDFAYSSLTGAPTNVSSFTNDAGYLTTAIDSTGVTSLIDAAVAALVDTAPATLDTLNELAAALGDDANFATTVTNAIAALPDSAEVATIVQSYGYTTYDSSNTLALVDSSYVQARQTPQDFAYSSLTGAPTNVSSFTNDAGYLTSSIDSAQILALIDSAYVNSLVTTGTDSATVVSLITQTVDSAYINARVDAVGGGTDSATVVSLINSTIDSDFVLGLVGASVSGVNTYEYTAIDSQTVFSGIDDNGATLAYTTDNILVHRNGVLLVSTIDYVATNGTSVVLQSAADSDDTISVIAYQPTLVNASETTITSDVQTATSGQTSFTVAHTQGQILVFLNGILLKDTDDYVSNGSTVELTQTADSGDQITVHNFAKYSAAGSGGSTNTSAVYAYSILFGA